MRVALIHKAKFPVDGYGGTERVVWWLAKGLWELGHQVTLYCAEGSTCSFAKVVPIQDEHIPLDPSSFDCAHYFNTPKADYDYPFVVTIGGNGKKGELYSQNTVFVSRNHAERHGAVAFVHNGVDPSEYIFSD